MSTSAASTDSIIYTINPAELLHFFDKNNLSTTILITIIGFRIGEFVLDIYNLLFYPLINYKQKGENIEDVYIMIKNKKIEIGKIALSLIRVIIIMYLMYMVAIFIKKASKKPTH